MQFNQEDQKWIIETSKDLTINQISRILKVDSIHIENFLDSVAFSATTLSKPSFNNLKKKLTKEFVEKMIQEDHSQDSLSIRFDIPKLTLKRALKENGLNWNQIKNDLKEKEINSSTQKCSKCKKVLDKNCFYKDKRSKSGLSNWCKDCKSSASYTF